MVFWTKTRSRNLQQSCSPRRRPAPPRGGLHRSACFSSLIIAPRRADRAAAPLRSGRRWTQASNNKPRLRRVDLANCGRRDIGEFFLCRLAAGGLTVAPLRRLLRPAAAQALPQAPAARSCRPNPESQPPKRPRARKTGYAANKNRRYGNLPVNRSLIAASFGTASKLQRKSSPQPTDPIRTMHDRRKKGKHPFGRLKVLSTCGGALKAALTIEENHGGPAAAGGLGPVLSGGETVFSRISHFWPPRFEWRQAFIAVGLSFLAFGPSRAAELSAIRFGETGPDETRVVFDLTGPAEYTLFGDGEGAGRLIIEFKGLTTAGAADSGGGHVLRYVVSPTGTGAARAILDFRRTAKIKGEPFLLEPSGGNKQHRLVIDLETSDKAAFLASLPPRYEDLTSLLADATGPTAPAASKAPAEESADALPMIVIDAGHGGNDPGAQGPNGVFEKAVTLAAATKLSELLMAKERYRIVMTRPIDTRRSLEDRSNAARDAGADLFISLHADAHENVKIRGASVYTLSEEGGQRSAREVQSQGDYQVWNYNINEPPDPNLSKGLLDKAQDYTKTNSSIFADILVENLKAATPLINNTHRTADLYVLLSPDVPAVLLELGFISNRSDESNLNSPAWREKV
ncbi:MAG: N-acetylmuramoyl-L-alanine amidase, partial [Parvularculaceae bacterium]